MLSQELTSMVDTLPTKTLLAISKAHNAFGKFGHQWSNCIFGRAGQIETNGQVVSGVEKCGEVWNLSKDEKDAVGRIILQWDTNKFGQNEFIETVLEILSCRSLEDQMLANEDLVFKPLPRVVNVTESVKFPSTIVEELETISDVELWDFIAEGFKNDNAEEASRAF